LLCIYPEEQKMMQDSYQLTTVKAIWDFLEVFYVDKNAASWLPERLVDWLASYDGVLSSATLFSKLANLQQKLLNLRVSLIPNPLVLLLSEVFLLHSRALQLSGANVLWTCQFPEDDEEYWDGIASALAVGWLDIVVCPLQIHTLALVVSYEYAST
jgi:nuclear pore complex protein Nup85